jgi:predicted metal-dependent hydrolase
MHPITVRTMKFDVPSADEFHPLCIAGNSALSYTHLATSLYVAHLEPFFVKSLRRVMDQIRDEALREDVDRFSRQEAQHYQRHIDFNKAVFAQGYPGLEQRVDELKRDFERFLAEETDRFRIGYIEGFESYTTQFALWILSSGLYDHRRTARPIGDLFKWHMVEEVEHRNVAFDVYEHLYGGYLHRARMCWVSQRHMFRFIADCMQLMSAFDIARHGERCRLTMRQKVLMAQSRFGMRARSMLPGYTPHKYVLPSNIAELSAHFTQLAQSIR